MEPEQDVTSNPSGRRRDRACDCLQGMEGSSACLCPSVPIMPHILNQASLQNSNGRNLERLFCDMYRMYWGMTVTHQDTRISYKIPWSVMCRELMEGSSACLCPSVAYQLAGAKKVQQDLAQGAVLRRFTRSQEDADLLQACFAGEGTPAPGADQMCEMELLRKGRPARPRGLCYVGFCTRRMG